MKKIILLAIIILLIFVPKASAEYEERVWDEENLIIVSYTFDEDSVNIDDIVSFTLILENTSDYTFTLVSVDQVFEGIGRWNEDISPAWNEEFTINPKESLEIEYTFTVSKNIIWYSLNGDYYADFVPHVRYRAEDAGDDLLCSLFMNKSSDISKVKIDNLSDGSEYIDVEYLDDISIYKYSYTQSMSKFTEYDEYYGNVINYINITNISEGPVSITNIINSTNPLQNCGYEYILDTQQSMIAGCDKYDTKALGDIQDKVTVEGKVMFTVEEGEYLAVEIGKDLQTVILPVPDVEVKRTIEDGSIKYTVENISDETIYNFFVNHEYLLMGKEQMDDFITSGDFAPGEIWEITKDGGDSRDPIYLGYYMQESVHYWIVYNDDPVVTLTEYDFLYSYFEDYYFLINDIWPTNIWQENIIQEAQDNEVSKEKENEDNDSDMDSENSNPNYLWAILAAVIVTFVIIFITTVVGNKKDR